MTVGSTPVAVLLAAIPVTAMLFIELGFPFPRKREEGTKERSENVAVSPAHTAEVPRSRPISRCQQGGRYYRILHQTAQSGDLASMDKLGEFALVRRDFVEAFYWKLMVELHHRRPSGLSARGVCQTWQGAGCPASNTDEGGLFKEDQANLSMAVLNLWSGRHIQTPRKVIRQMMEEGDRNAILVARHLGIGRDRS